MGFGFAGRDSNRGLDLVLPWMDLVLQVTSWSEFDFAMGLFFFSFFLLLLLLSASFIFFVSQVSKTKSSA